MTHVPAVVGTVLGVVLGAAVGILAIVTGESDDSPGLQLLGVVLVLGAAALGVRAARRRR